MSVSPHLSACIHAAAVAEERGPLCDRAAARGSVNACIELGSGHLRKEIVVAVLCVVQPIDFPAELCASSGHDLWISISSARHARGAAWRLL